MITSETRWRTRTSPNITNLVKRALVKFKQHSQSERQKYGVSGVAEYQRLIFKGGQSCDGFAEAMLDIKSEAGAVITIENYRNIIHAIGLATDALCIPVDDQTVSYVEHAMYCAAEEKRKKEFQDKMENKQR